MAAAQKELRRTAHARLSRQDMEDIIQDAFVRLYSRNEAACPVANMAAFIRRTARNLLFDRYRALSPQEVSGEEMLVTIADETASPERALLGQQAWEAVTQELDRLPEKTRSLFLQHRLGAVTLRELEQRHQIPRSTACEQIRAVMERLNKVARPYL